MYEVTAVYQTGSYSFKDEEVDEYATLGEAVEDASNHGWEMKMAELQRSILIITCGDLGVVAVGMYVHGCNYPTDGARSLNLQWTFSDGTIREFRYWPDGSSYRAVEVFEE
jgi:hypothetical protein